MFDNHFILSKETEGFVSFTMKLYSVNLYSVLCYRLSKTKDRTKERERMERYNEV